MKNLLAGEGARMTLARGMTLPLEGAICSEVPTPFAADGSIDEAALADLVAFLAQHADALIVTTEFGEVLSLSPDERRRVAEISIQAAGHTPVIVQVTAFSTVESCQLALHAEQAGAAAVAAGRPYYWHLSEAATSDYFGAIAHTVQCPLLAVSRAEAPIAPAVLLRLAALEPNLAGVIELGTSSLAALEISRLAERQGRHLLTMLNVMTAASAAYGSHCAFLSHLDSISPNFARGAADAAKARNVRMTRELAGRLLSLQRVLGRDPARVKYAMRRTGRPFGEARLPLSVPGADARRAIDEELARQSLFLSQVIPQNSTARGQNVRAKENRVR